MINIVNLDYPFKIKKNPKIKLKKKNYKELKCSIPMLRYSFKTN